MYTQCKVGRKNTDVLTQEVTKHSKVIGRMPIILGLGISSKMAKKHTRREHTTHKRHIPRVSAISVWDLMRIHPY